jgi:RNA polymerase sigma-70 factor (ECF subfamily)
MMVERMNDTTGREPESDHDLIRAALSRDQSACAAIVRRYTPVVYSLALRTLANRADAEDAVQEIFLKVFSSLGRFDSSRGFYSWIYTIALNYLRSALRRPSFRRRQDLPVEEEVVAMPEELGPEAKAVETETRRLVERAVGTLGPVQRRVFVLRQFQGLSTAETARLLGLPQNTVKTHLRRARQLVAGVLSADETPVDTNAYMKMEENR